MNLIAQSRLMKTLLNVAGNQADSILSDGEISAISLERRISDLEISPLHDKQLLATALRVAGDLGLSSGVRNSLFNRFQNPAPTVAIDAQRRAIISEVKAKGLPMELAMDYANTLERRLTVSPEDLGETLWAYASVYEEIWSDPRIGARAPTRRIMLAMATVLRARSAQLAMNASLTTATAFRVSS